MLLESLSRLMDGDVEAQMWKGTTLAVESMTSWFVNQWLVKKSQERPDQEKIKNFAKRFETEDPLVYFGETCGEAAPLWQEEGLIWKGGRASVDWRFASAVQSGVPRNDEVRGRSLLHADVKQSSKGSHIILLHGWLTPGHQQSLWVADKLWKEGFSTHLLELPFHMRRTPPGFFSGAYLIQPDLPILFEALRQAVTDLRTLIRSLRAQGIHDIGLMGISMGGFVAALTSCLESDLSSLSLIAPLVDLGYTLEHSPMTKVARSLLKGFAPSEWKPLFAPLDLTRYRPLLARDRILIAKPLFDRVVYPEKIHALWHMWGRPTLLSEAHGHVTIFFSRLPFLRIIDHLRHREPLPAVWKPAERWSKA